MQSSGKELFQYKASGIPIGAVKKYIGGVHVLIDSRMREGISFRTIAALWLFFDEGYLRSF
jgi:hypothetical protein